MKTKTLILILSIFVAFTAKAQSVDEIINHHLDAIGGSKKLAELKSVAMIGSIEVGPGMKAPFHLEIKDNKKIRFELELQGMKMITAFDGENGWKVVPFTGKSDAERMSPEEIKDAQQQADATGDLFNYKAKGSTVELIDKEDMEGTDVYKLKITKKTGDVAYLYIDANSYLILKQTNVVKMADKEVKASTIMSNYQEINGYKFPLTMETREGDGEQQGGQAMTIEKVTVNPVIEDNDFVMPTASAAPAPTDKK